MAIWEDLDSESRSEKEEAEDEANVAVGLVATLTSEAEVIESLKELLTHFELRTNELTDLKEKYVEDFKDLVLTSKICYKKNVMENH